VLHFFYFQEEASNGIATSFTEYQQVQDSDFFLAVRAKLIGVFVPDTFETNLA